MKSYISIRNSILIFLLIILIHSRINSQGIMVRSGWGAHDAMIFGGFGYINPQVIDNKQDMMASFGLGLGDPNVLGLQAGFVLANLTKDNKFTFVDFKAHRYLNNGYSLALGIENAFFSGNKESGRYAPVTPYISLSQSVAMSGTSSPFLKRLSYTLGAGFGRFAELSDADKLLHDRKNGTYLYSAIQFQLLKFLSLTAEWSGINLNAGITISPRFGNLPIGVTIAAANLTNYSGNGTKLLAGIGMVYKFGGIEKKKEITPEDTEIYKDTLLAKEAENEAKLLEIKRQAEMAEKLTTELLENQQKLINRIAELESRLAKLDGNKDEMELLLDSVQKTPNGEKLAGVLAYDLTKDQVFKYVDGASSGRVEPGYYVVLFTNKTKKYAMQSIGRLNYIGLKVRIAYNQDKDFYYVITEGYDNMRDAAKRCKEIREFGYKDAWIHKY